QVYQKLAPLISMNFDDNSKAPSETPIVADDIAFSSYDGPVGHSWTCDPYALGGYSYISPGQEEALATIEECRGEKVRSLFAPIHDRLYFAGEHTSVLVDVPGTMEAACESGERCARMIAATDTPLHTSKPLQTSEQDARR